MARKGLSTGASIGILILLLALIPAAYFIGVSQAGDSSSDSVPDTDASPNTGQSTQDTDSGTAQGADAEPVPDEAIPDIFTVTIEDVSQGELTGTVVDRNDPLFPAAENISAGQTVTRQLADDLTINRLTFVDNQSVIQQNREYRQALQENPQVQREAPPSIIDTIEEGTVAGLSQGELAILTMANTQDGQSRTITTIDIVTNPGVAE